MHFEGCDLGGQICITRVSGWEERRRQGCEDGEDEVVACGGSGGGGESGIVVVLGDFVCGCEVWRANEGGS